MLALIDLKWKINIDLECNLIFCKNIDGKLLGFIRFICGGKCDSYNLLPLLISEVSFS